MTRLGRVVAALLATLVAVAGLAVGPAAASADDAAPECPNGIYVYVIEQDEILVEGCSQAETAMARLLDLTTVQTVGQGFICQIADRPDSCEKQPGGDEPYWSFWWWRDGAWVYATVGGSFKGEPGSIEAWHFAPGVPPTTTPGQSAGSSPGASPAPAATHGRPAEPDPTTDADGGLPSWAPTAITAAVIALAGLGYFVWYRNRPPREQR